MNDTVETEPAETTSATQKQQINMPRLLDITGGILHQGFIVPERSVGKQRFKEIKQGGNPAVGEVKVGEDLKFEIKLALDYSRYVGGGFNFDVYQRFVKGLLGLISTHLKARTEFRFRTSEQGGVLVDLPVALEVNDQINVMFLIFEFGQAGEITVNLSFFDPGQFKRTERAPDA